MSCECCNFKEWLDSEFLEWYNCYKNNEEIYKGEPFPKHNKFLFCINTNQISKNVLKQFINNCEAMKYSNGYEIIIKNINGLYKWCVKFHIK